MGATELQENTTDRIQSTYSSDLDLSASKTPHISLNIGSGSQTESEVRLSQKQSGKQIHYLHFGTLNRSLTEMSDLMQGGRVWLLLDEWSTIPLDLQVYLADLLRRCFFTINNFTVKIASIEHRTQLQTPLSGGAYIGIELGADAQANLNLDDFMVFDNDEMRAKEFFKALVFKHFRASEGLDADVGPQSGNDLISKAFTQITAFEEFVRAVEGVPRDAINIIESAAQRAFDERISVIHVRQAAHDWYVRDKARPIRDDEKAFALLNWIIDEVIGHRRARAFLLRADRKDPIVDKLFDARLIHLLKRSVATKDEPGVRYAVFKLDYGCYVDLINTQKQPIGLLQVDPEEEGAAGYVEVPPDDYRSIRRAILDLDRFRRSGAASSRIGSVEIGSVE